MNEFIIAVIPFEADQIAKINPIESKPPLEFLVTSLITPLIRLDVSAGALLNKPVIWLWSKLNNGNNVNRKINIGNIANTK